VRQKARVIVGIGAIAVVVGVVGCGSSGSASTSSTPALNGENTKTATQILTDAQAATASATSVHVLGTVPQGSSSLEMDLHVGSNQTATGSMLLGGQSLEIIRIGTTVYFKAPAAFYTSQGASSASSTLLGGHWVKVPASMATSSSYANFFNITDLHKLMGVLLTPIGAVTVAGQGTVAGTPVVYVADRTGGKLAISLEGKPYPLEITSGKNSTGQVTFSSWNGPIAARPPAGALNLSALGG